MENETKAIWQIRVMALVIFVLGFLAGIGGLYSYQAWVPAAKQQTKRERYEEAFGRLGMNESQRAEVDIIIGDLRQRLLQLRQDAEPKVQEIRAESDARLQKVLSAEQWQQFQAERESIRQEERERSLQYKMR